MVMFFVLSYADKSQHAEFCYLVSTPVLHSAEHIVLIRKNDHVVYQHQYLLICLLSVYTVRRNPNSDSAKLRDVNRLFK